MAESVVGTTVIGDNDLIIQVIAEGQWPTRNPDLGWIVGYDWQVKDEHTKARLKLMWQGDDQILELCHRGGLSGSIRFPVGKRMHTGYAVEHRTAISRVQRRG